jgi:hypothetical protein
MDIGKGDITKKTNHQERKRYIEAKIGGMIHIIELFKEYFRPQLECYDLPTLLRI